MKPIVKNTLITIGSFIAYRFYKLYELGESIIYKPVDWQFDTINWSSLTNGVNLRVTIELLNPTNTTLKMRGIDGELKFNGDVISTFFSQPFDIYAGRSTFDLVFNIKGINVINQLASYIRDRKNDKVSISVRKKIPFFTLTDTFNLSITKKVVSSLSK